MPQKKMKVVPRQSMVWNIPFVSRPFVGVGSFRAFADLVSHANESVDRRRSKM
jgi:hypothetical protein